VGILRYLIRRLLFAVVLVFGVSAIIFFLLNAIGNPIDVLMADNPGISDELLANVKAYYHLDASVGQRYLFWLGNVARLDFGTSITNNTPVGAMLITWGAETLKLQIPAILLALVLSIGFATIAAMRQYSRVDFGVMSSALLGHSLPGFLLGVLLILIFAYWLGIFPSYGAYSTRNPLMGSYVIDGLWHMVLPLTMLTVFNTATLTLLLRGNLVDVLRQDFIMAARASGLPERRVVFHHALRNAIIPVLTYLGILFGLMLATAPVTESVFTWPGAGALYLASIQSLDYPVIMAITLVVTVMLVGFSLLTDLAYVLIDPRIRLD
jgi:ABC-type dipeptide/oligopeptide/nickel transport system permease component